MRNGTNKQIESYISRTRKINKWLAEQLEKDSSVLSKQCTNTTQPDFVTLTQMAEILGIDRRYLLMPQK